MSHSLGKIGLAGVDLDVYSIYKPSTRAKNLFKKAGEQLSEEYNRDTSKSEIKSAPNVVEVEMFTRNLAIEWLRSFSRDIDWESVLSYLDQIRYRTYENDAVAINIIVESTRAGHGMGNLNNVKHQKVYDMAGSSRDTIVRVSSDLGILRYETCGLDCDNVAVRKSVRGAPHIAVSLWEYCSNGSFLVQKTRRGDILISSATDGLIATWRKGFWHLYEKAEMLTIYNDLFGMRGGRILDLVYDLSYRRHGALLVYDPDKKVRKHKISNPHSKIRRIQRQRVDAYSVIGPSVRAMMKTDSYDSYSGIVAEVASMDGAIVFDQDGICAFGAMIVTNRKVGNVQGGARTTAMLSAKSYGGIPVKISADGDVTLAYVKGTINFEIQYS